MNDHCMMIYCMDWIFWKINEIRRRERKKREKKREKGGGRAILNAQNKNDAENK